MLFAAGDEGADGLEDDRPAGEQGQYDRCGGGREGPGDLLGGWGRDDEIGASALTEDDCPLTARELDVLRAARTGDSVHAIAQHVHLAEGTVRNYLSSAMAKLGVTSRHAATYRAWEEGWI